MQDNPYQNGDKLHVMTKQNGRIMAIVEGVEGNVLHLEEPLKANHYKLTLDGDRSGAIVNESDTAPLDDEVVNLTFDKSSM